MEGLILLLFVCVGGGRGRSSWLQLIWFYLTSCSSKTVYGMWSFFLYGPTIQLPLPAKSIILSWNVLHIRTADISPKCSQKWAQYWKLRVSLPDGSNQEIGPFFVLILDRGFQRMLEDKWEKKNSPRSESVISGWEISMTVAETELREAWGCF